MAPTEKQIKAAVKEGGKKGQDLAGMSDMGGVKFFSVAVESALGKWELLDKILEGMNKDVDPTADDRKGGAGHIAKCLLFADENVLLMLCHVPVELQSVISQEEWFSKLTDAVGAASVGDKVELPGGKGSVLKAEVKADPDSEKFPLKERDVAIGRSFEYLVSKELVRQDDDDDDENYAENAGIEW